MLKGTWPYCFKCCRETELLQRIAIRKSSIIYPLQRRREYHLRQCRTSAESHRSDGKNPLRENDRSQLRIAMEHIQSHYIFFVLAIPGLDVITTTRNDFRLRQIQLFQLRHVSQTFHIAAIQCTNYFHSRYGQFLVIADSFR